MLLQKALFHSFIWLCIIALLKKIYIYTHTHIHSHTHHTTPFFIYSSINRQFRLLPCLAIVNSGAVNIGVLYLFEL